MTNTTEPQDGKGVARGWSVQSQNPARPQQSQQEDAAPAHPFPQSVRSPNDVSNVQLVLFGVFGGVYLLYTVGWFLIAQYFAAANALAAATSGTLGGVLQQVIFWSAAAAPIAWFVVVVMIARSSRPWVLPLGLVLGVIVLLPLPLFTVGVS